MTKFVCNVCFKEYDNREARGICQKKHEINPYNLADTIAQIGELEIPRPNPIAYYQILDGGKELRSFKAFEEAYEYYTLQCIYMDTTKSKQITLVRVDGPTRQCRTLLKFGGFVNTGFHHVDVEGWANAKKQEYEKRINALSQQRTIEGTGLAQECIVEICNKMEVLDELLGLIRDNRGNMP